MKIFRNTIGLLILALSLNAHAQENAQATGLFLEPGISYQMTETNLNYPTPYANSSASTKGFGVLGRAGVHIYERFFVAADGRYALLNYNDNANGISV